MMINCPNCNLLQPKDQYCAQCGINMETWKPPSKPLWKKVISNWMVQLGALFCVIFVVVLQDSFKSKNDTSARENLPPVSRQIERDTSKSFASSRQKLKPKSETQNKKIALQSASRFEKLKNVSPQSTDKGKQPILEMSAKLGTYLLSRNAIEQIASQGRKVDDAIYVVNRKSMMSLIRKNRREFRSIGRLTRPYLLGQTRELFLGEQDSETDANLGFFAQINVATSSTPDNKTLEARFWYQLKPGQEGPAINYEGSLSGEQILVVIDSSVHEVEFTNEERSLFESSPYLRALNDEGFIESLSDIGLVLEID